MTTSNPVAPTLTGEALIQKNDELSKVNAPKGAIVLACGYQNEQGNPDYTGFYSALLEAKGVNLANPSNDKVDNTDVEGEYLYEINIPVYVSVSVYRKPGMNKNDVINSVTWDDIAETDTFYISDSIEDALMNEKNAISVFDEAGDKVA